MYTKKVTFKPTEFEHNADYESFMFNIGVCLKEECGCTVGVEIDDNDNVTVCLPKDNMETLFKIAKRYGYSEFLN